ncbi:CesT family type III secretion system chaperone [Acanthopleuribacter pedis]|uniref:Type III secretion system chaperone n=1 Tax=Acanthopleuribacter pedis TaxID=442870 RepID=A0A8J7U432_9BACT|nr:CesT family type III secretion system chaperone [Acanthopleuribacter pedis]MBO1319394.1 type III secretion system chaperone [Acanthopleuribacter pedis]
MMNQTTPATTDLLDTLMADFAERTGIDHPERDDDACYGLLFNPSTVLYLREDPERNRITLFTPFDRATDRDQGKDWCRLLQINATEPTTLLRFALEPQSKIPILILEIAAKGLTIDLLENAVEAVLAAAERAEKPASREANPGDGFQPEPDSEHDAPVEEFVAPVPAYLLA